MEHDETPASVWTCLDRGGRAPGGLRQGNQQYKAARKAESLNDYDTALENYNKALRAEPNNTEYKLKAARARFEASQWHVDQGRRLREQSNLELAIGEFRKAQMIGPFEPRGGAGGSCTMGLIAAKQGTTQNSTSSPATENEPK